ncbi:regulatory iron-sulfur-containing complex subunit RicT [Oceanivirga miroungae]|uniref:PSP1 domain-containing protein n=1 Tax=Oceanivirga miroungae TaxID=1130046 RepID=A0A6I8M622_9FUSO|nr:regulatory iron-sulfur-containing complex subunit RicT [Oceanivirga miroungae]VWL84791.1 PSP1 domain-containing protein [Oceanivirga miroungae]
MKILSIRFRKTKKVYPFVIKDEEKYKIGDTVIVETIRGAQIGTVIHKKEISEENEDNNDIKIREISRKLTEEEIESLIELDKKADEAYFKCKKIIKRVLPKMNLVIGEYTFNEEKLIFYFTASDRLDFRELVREVNKEFNRRVEFYQIKPNDEGKILNVFGKYGKEIYW